MSNLSRYAVDWARLCESWERACEEAMQDAYSEDNRELYLFASTMRGQIAAGRSVMVAQVTVDMKMSEQPTKPASRGFRPMTDGIDYDSSEQ